MTQATKMLLRVLLDAAGPLYGLEIATKADLPSGTIHPILARLEKAKWLESSWEPIDPHAEGRPRRRYYKLTDEGAKLAREGLGGK